MKFAQPHPPPPPPLPPQNKKEELFSPSYRCLILVQRMISNDSFSGTCVFM